MSPEEIPSQIFFCEKMSPAKRENLLRDLIRNGCVVSYDSGKDRLVVSGTDIQVENAKILYKRMEAVFPY